MNKLNNKKQYTVKEIAEILGISRIAVFKKIKNRQMKAKMVGKTYIIEANELKDFLAKGSGNNIKREIEKGVAKVVKEYGETLKLLGKE